MRLLVTGATGFLGWRATSLLRERGHAVVPVIRPGGARRALAELPDARDLDAGDPRIRELLGQGCDAVLHFAGIPDPARAREDPARAVRENVGTTLNLLEACGASGPGLVYPSTVRATQAPLDAYARSKRLGELACELHPARTAVIRLPSVYGPGQVAWEGATGAIAAFAARSLEGEPIVIPGDPERTRDFVHVDDVIDAIEAMIAGGAWDCTVTLASGVSTPLIEAARMVRDAAGSDSPIHNRRTELPTGEDDSYAAIPTPGLDFHPRAVERGIPEYVHWLRRHPAAQGSS